MLWNAPPRVLWPRYRRFRIGDTSRTNHGEDRQMTYIYTSSSYYFPRAPSPLAKKGAGREGERLRRYLPCVPGSSNCPTVDALKGWCEMPISNYLGRQYKAFYLGSCVLSPSHVCDRPALLTQIVSQDGAVRPDGVHQVGGSHIYEYRLHPLLMLRELQQEFPLPHKRRTQASSHKNEGRGGGGKIRVKAGGRQRAILATYVLPRKQWEAVTKRVSLGGHSS